MIVGTIIWSITTLHRQNYFVLYAYQHFAYTPFLIKYCLQAILIIRTQEV